MKTLACVFGLCIFTVGAVGIIAPSSLIWIARRAATPGAFYAVATTRVAFGLVLVLEAPASRAPKALRVLGYVIRARRDRDGSDGPGGDGSRSRRHRLVVGTGHRRHPPHRAPSMALAGFVAYAVPRIDARRRGDNRWTRSACLIPASASAGGAGVRLRHGRSAAAVVGFAVTDQFEIVLPHAGFDTQGSEPASEQPSWPSSSAGSNDGDERTVTIRRASADEPSGAELEVLKQVYYAAYRDGPSPGLSWPGLIYVRVRSTWHPVQTTTASTHRRSSNSMPAN